MPIRNCWEEGVQYTAAQFLAAQRDVMAAAWVVRLEGDSEREFGSNSLVV